MRTDRALLSAQTSLTLKMNLVILIEAASDVAKVKELLPDGTVTWVKPSTKKVATAKLSTGRRTPDGPPIIGSLHTEVYGTRL